MLNVKDFGAVGNGSTDDSPALQRALDSCASGGGVLVIPAGDYRVASTLKISSGTRIEADCAARLFLCGDTKKQRGDFLITNRDHFGGDSDISIFGGIWDGNNSGRCNTKDPDLFNKNAWSGTTVDFYNVRNLRLESMVLANSVTYNIRMCRISDFHISDISFYSKEKAFNQDGLHFGGFVKNGTVANVRAISKGQTNDDMLAFNADDSMERLENLDLERGPIENISVDGVYAEDCHTAVRMCSVDSPIRGIKVKNMETGVRCYALNMDAARYCRTPLFRGEDRPRGVGCVENVEFENFTMWFTCRTENPLMCLETNIGSLSMRGVRRDQERDRSPGSALLRASNVCGMRITADGGSAGEALLEKMSDRFEVQGTASEFEIRGS